MKVDLIQTSFAGGQFGSSLLGRVDIAQYANACKIVENFLIRSYGSVVSTPGTRYIGAVSNSTLKTRLIKFVFNRSDAYVIEMGKYYFRFYTNGGIVVTTGTTPYVLTHVYDDTEIFNVQFTQLNDVLYLTHPNHPPQKMTRLSAASWTIEDFAFKGGPFLDDNTDTSITLIASATTGTVNITVSPTTTSLFTVSGSTLGHHNSYWMIGGLAQTVATTGLQETGYVKITDVINAYTATATVIKNLKVSTATADWAEGAWNSVRGYPASVTFHGGRLYFARTAEEPQKVWGSKVFQYDDFALDTEADDDGLNLALASNEANEIKWLTSGKNLFAGTYGGAFVISSGSSSETLTPANATASEEVGFGSEAIQPKKIGSFLYYIQRFGRKLRELYYTWDLDTYKSVDKTILSPEILGNGVVDMDIAQNPETILYCVLTSGTLATLTREVDQEVQAWSRQTTSGTYCSVAIIPSQTSLYDEVWVIVQRWINGVETRYIEQFESIEPPDRQDLCLYLHSALTYNAFLTATSSAVTISLSATAGTITVTASAPAFAQTHVGKRLRSIDGNGVIKGEGTITATAGTTGCTLTVSYAFDTTAYAVNRWGISVASVSGLDHLETEEVNVLADGGTDYPVKTVATGAITLAHDYFVISAGLAYDQIIYTLPKEAGNARGTAQGKIQKINEVAFKVNNSHKGFKVGGTEDELDTVSYIESTTEEILYTGTIPNADFVCERISFRDPATPLGTPEILYTGIISNISFRDDYRYGSQVYIKNSDPLPLEILSVMMTVDTFEK